MERNSTKIKEKRSEMVHLECSSMIIYFPLLGHCLKDRKKDCLHFRYCETIQASQ